MDIRPTKIASSYMCYSAPDAEEIQIMRRLLYVYGINPTGNKAVDKEKLKQCELKQFLSEKVVSNKYLTLSENEQNKILEKFKENKKEVDNKTNDSQPTLNNIGASLKGEQLYIAIKLNQKRKI